MSDARLNSSLVSKFVAAFVSAKVVRQLRTQDYLQHFTTNQNTCSQKASYCVTLGPFEFQFQKEFHRAIVRSPAEGKTVALKFKPIFL